MLLPVELWFFFVFFFSSRRRHTRLQGDWSSDVCSSDLEIGLDVPKWKEAVDSHSGQAAIQADMNAGNAVGANGTPTFFINGRRLVGAMPFESFKQIIDAELSSKVAKK